jgi:hypothetical protein
MIARDLNSIARACHRHGVIPTRFLFLVNITKQTAYLFERQKRGRPRPRSGGVVVLESWTNGSNWPNNVVHSLSSRRRSEQRERSPSNNSSDAHGSPLNYTLRKTFRCSTSRFGIGEKAGSNMTPRGLHRIAEKIGGGWPAGAVFKSRQFVGYTWQGMPEALITTRILWLEGLESGFNRGGDLDSHARYIYIHGTGNPLTLGRPASHGCTYLADHDLVALYDKLPSGTLVWIAER